jgi:hydroxymethylglutaryl-CoA lyase
VTSLPTAVRIREEGPRDGWQNIDEPFIPTDTKLALIGRLLDSGVRHISVTSMVSPKWVPQLADADELLTRLSRRPGVSYEVLVPNPRGLDRLLPLVDEGAPTDEIGVVVSASEAHNRANLNRSIAETLDGIRAMARRIESYPLRLVASVATAFGCSLSGAVPPQDVAALAEALVAEGATEIILGDTTGMASPRQVSDVLDAVTPAAAGATLTMHFHDTRGAGLANILMSLQAGISSFETSYGELGGCQFARGATGNVATESLVSMLDGMGIATGLDIGILVDVIRQTELALGCAIPSKLASAGEVAWQVAEEA